MLTNTIFIKFVKPREFFSKWRTFNRNKFTAHRRTADWKPILNSAQRLQSSCREADDFPHHTFSPRRKCNAVKIKDRRSCAHKTFTTYGGLRGSNSMSSVKIIFYGYLFSPLTFSSCIVCMYTLWNYNWYIYLLKRSLTNIR